MYIDVPKKRAIAKTLMIHAMRPIFFLAATSGFETALNMRCQVSPINGKALWRYQSTSLQTVLSLNIARTGFRLHGVAKSIDASMEPLESNGAQCHDEGTESK